MQMVLRKSKEVKVLKISEKLSSLQVEVLVFEMTLLPQKVMRNLL